MEFLALSAFLIFAFICNTTRGDSDIVQQLVVRIEALEKQDNNHAHLQDELKYELRETKEKVRQQDELIHALRTELHRTKLDIANKENRITLLEKQVKTPNASANVAKGKVRQRPAIKGKYDLTTTTQELKDDTTKRRNVFASENLRHKRIFRPTRFLGQPVAFHAVSNQLQQHLGIHQSILFEMVITNIGKAFHVNHGTFIAPTHGIYIFSVSAASAGYAAHLAIATELVKDGSLLAKTYSKSDTGYPDQGSVTVLTELQSGNEVWVRLNHPADTTLEGSYYSSFTGMLLHEYEV